MTTVTIDGSEIQADTSMTVLEACTQAGVDIPTLCYGPPLEPAGVCRICVVEVEGARALVASCHRTIEDGMVIHTSSSRVVEARRMVGDLLGSEVDLSLSALDSVQSPSGPLPSPKIQDGLYVRDYAKCVLCYRCVDACGDQAQNSFAITVAGRGNEAHISTEFDVLLPDSACVYCGNCIGVCPTGALIPRVEFDLRATGDWRPEEQTVTRTVCPYCGVGCNLDLTVQDNQIVRADSPVDHDVTSGHLCIKGRFGWQYVGVPERRSSS